MAGEMDMYSGKRKTISSGDDGIQSIYILSGSFNSPRACALFEFKIRITGKEELGDEKKIEIIKENGGQLRLRKIQDFYDQTPDENRDHDPKTRLVYCAAAAPLPGKGASFLLVPNEYSQPDELYLYPKLDVSRIPSLTYNVLTAETSHFSDFPNERKASPFVASVNNMVYVLSRPRFMHTCIVEPSFEVFDPMTNSWSALAPPPFYKDPARLYTPSGYVVYKDYIIFSFETAIKREKERTTIATFCSYHTLTKQWKRVQKTSTEASYYYWREEAVVANGAIYGYRRLATMVAYLLTENKDGSLSLGPQIDVEGVRKSETDYSFGPNVAIGKIGDRLLCEISTISPRDLEKQPVWITFYYIYKHGHCHDIGSFQYIMPCDDQFFLGTFLSFLVMLPNADDGEGNELGREKRVELCKDYDRAKALDVEMTESARDITGTVA